MLSAKFQPGDPSAPKPPSSVPNTDTATKKDAAGMGVGIYAVVLVGAAVAFGAYRYLQAGSETGK